MLRRSVTEVCDQLQTAGLEAYEMDPYVIYSKVCSVFSNYSGERVVDLMWRFTKRTATSDYGSLEAF